ncbi:MAG: hypothetical protein R3D57_05550 [Hyphomicrobiaceae bacterium]
MTDPRSATGANLNVLEPNGLLASALELGEPLNMTGKRAHQLRGQTPLGLELGKKRRSLRLLREVDFEAVHYGDFCRQHRFELIAGFDAIYRRQDGTDPYGIDRPIAELAGRDQAIELSQGERVADRAEGHMQSLSRCRFVTRNLTDLLERAFGVGFDVHREPRRCWLGNRIGYGDRVYSWSDVCRLL